MTLEAAISEIKSFWNKDEPFPFGRSDNRDHIDRLNAEFGVAIPTGLQDYVKNFVPLEDFYFDTVGNPMRIYGIDNLRYKQEGYNYNPVMKAVIEDWKNSLFIFADEGADPVIIDFDNLDDGIQKLVHGSGNWDHGETIADTFGQFLLCSAAQHHALNNFEEDPIIDDSNGFNLADDAATWYFKNMKNWAGKYYQAWCAVFVNH